MDSVAASRRNRKTNKENDRPVFERRPVVKRDKQPAAPFQLRTSSKEGTLSKSDARFATETQKRVKTFIKDGREAAATGKQPARSRAVLCEQVAKDNRTIEEVPAPPATAPSKLGLYKGKVVQSKIGAIWKTSTTVSSAETKPPTIKAKIPNVKNNVQSTSAAAAAARRPAVQKPAQVARSAVTGRPPPAQCFPARPPTRPVHSKISNTVPRSSKKAPSNENSKPSTLRAEKVNKPASSSLSQYRLTMETAEERRAKLAGWLASKGKTLKRPTMATTALSKVSAKPRPEPRPLPQPAERHNTQPRLAAQEPDSSAAAPPPPPPQCAQKQEAAVTTISQTPAIMNTTLDLLENSDADQPVEPQEEIDDIIVNLCDALEAMETPSGNLDEPLEMTDVCSDIKGEGKAEDEDDGEQIENKKPKDGSDQLQVEQKEEASDDEEETEDETEDEAVQSKVEDVMESTPQQSASVVKYNVKTTPYLQSVRKTIEGEASTSVSKRKSNIKDLKFLTPVRRSCRIERKSSHLPTMLLDHDPCVTSLAELVKLDDDPNAYIYRKNPALAEDLPHH